ncbi:MAG: polyhydroxybutyrate depolymerase [Pseudomonadota bacterium]
MTLKPFLAALALLTAATSAAGDAPGCGGAAPCPVGEREYHAAPPPGWDGSSPLPALIHFHGWGRRSAGVLANRRVADAAAEAGALLIAPQGLGRSWSFWRPGSADSRFALAVLEDAATRWPVDRSRVVVSGFSYGGAMAWRLACDEGAVAARFLPIAGSLWRGDEDCTAPVAVSHVHGLKDTVLDYPFGPNGEEEAAVALWLRRNDCRAEPDEREEVGRFDCRRWTSCAGPPVELCTHGGGHQIPKDWLSYALPRALASSAP